MSPRGGAKITRTTGLSNVGSGTQFSVSGTLDLTESELPFVKTINDLRSGEIKGTNVVAHLPSKTSSELKTSRDLLMNEEIFSKVESKHGKFPVKHFIRTGMDPDTVISFIEEGKDKINLLKSFNGATLVIGAERRDGHFILTFFEPKKKSYIDSIKKRGRIISR